MATVKRKLRKKGEGHWITTEDDQHIYISGKGEFLPRGPGTKPPRKGGAHHQTPEGKARTAELVAKARAAHGKPAAKAGEKSKPFYERSADIRNRAHNDLVSAERRLKLTTDKGERARIKGEIARAKGHLAKLADIKQRGPTAAQKADAARIEAQRSAVKNKEDTAYGNKLRAMSAHSDEVRRAAIKADDLANPKRHFPAPTSKPSPKPGLKEQAAATRRVSGENPYMASVLVQKTRAARAARAAAGGGDEGAILGAFKAKDAKDAKGRNFVSLADLREHSGLPKERFDAALRKLRLGGKMSLDSHEGLVTPKEWQANPALRERHMAAAVHEAGSKLTWAQLRGPKAAQAKPSSPPKPGLKEQAAGRSPETIDRRFAAHTKEGWGKGPMGVGTERSEAAAHARAVRSKAIENVATWKKTGAPPGTRENLAKAREQAEKALSNARALGATKASRAKHYATLKAVKHMQRGLPAR